MSQLQQATLAGGCFWCIESAFNQVRGIRSAVSGYAGGHVETPDYKAVCTGDTGHAEVVQLQFDPADISFLEVLEIFFALHDPTQLNRQGNDIGTQYRSAIFYHDAEQQQVAESLIKQIEEATLWPDPVVTEVTPLSHFYPAEDYHQDYFNQHPENQYCNMVVAPKLAKFKQKFINRLK